MQITLYQVDAFTSEMFGGNPAAVCPLDYWLPDDLLQKIALENNLSETAFFVQEAEGFRIRWFTPTVEVDLCGHATLASAYVLFHELFYTQTQIIFYSRSGELRVSNKQGLLTLDFPADPPVDVPHIPELDHALGKTPSALLKGVSDYMAVFESESDIARMSPDFSSLGKIPCRGVIVTAPGSQVDFASRFFAPQSGINEDPVTGSAHTTLTPYWVSRLQKNPLIAKQISQRVGDLHCQLDQEHGRVLISGKAVLYMKGEINLKI